MMRQAIAIIAVFALAACTEQYAVGSHDLPSEDSYWRTKGSQEWSLLAQQKEPDSPISAKLLATAAGVAITTLLDGKPQVVWHHPDKYWRTWLSWAGQVAITESKDVKDAHIKLETLFSADNLAAHGLKPMICFYAVSRDAYSSMTWSKKGGTEHCPTEVVLEGRKEVAVRP